MRALTAISIAVALLIGLPGLSIAAEPALVSQGELGDLVSVRGLRLKGGVVSGTIVNHAKYPLTEVRLLIRYEWLWKDEQNPGPARDNPGRAEFYSIPDDIDVGAELRFRYRPSPPLVTRPDGRFRLAADVVSLTELLP